ncbi:MAG: ferredoxin-thioredoxin reductase catalytic domain-containing protein [Promethearchaeota archaeon]
MEKPTKQKKPVTTKEQARKFVKMVAKKQGWHLNPDTQFIDDLAEGFATNRNRFGYYSCPCRDADGEKALDKDIICPCDYCKPDMEEFGHCYCGLYLTEEFAATRKAPGGIPERRPFEL